jgi:hypothetical protein
MGVLLPAAKVLFLDAQDSGKVLILVAGFQGKFFSGWAGRLRETLWAFF